MKLKSLADELGLSVSIVKKFLRNHPSGRGRTFGGAEESLDREQERAVREAHARGELRRDRGATAAVAPPEESPEPELNAFDLAGLQPVMVAHRPFSPRGQKAHPVFLHQDLLAWLHCPETPIEQRKVFTRRVQEIMASGTPTRMKAVRGENAGWLRTPLGGNGGNQFYLWFLSYGSKVRGQEEATAALFETSPPGARFLRAVRHHDATREPLDVGAASDYAPLAASEVVGADEGAAFVDPLVEAQKDTVRDTSRIRIVRGRPGAGKTATLLAATSRLEGRALYVTWSSELASRAKEWLDAFGPEALEINIWTFRELLEHIDPSRQLPPECPFSEAVEELRRHAEPVLTNGTWRRDGKLLAEELYAEIYAHLVGAALPIQFRGRPACKEPRLSDRDYRERRQSLGDKPVECVLRVGSKLSSDAMRRMFAAPVAAFELARDLADGRLALDSSFAFDWVLVDEVQDLTLVEQWLLVDVVARSGKAKGVLPGMVVAGDESQTVRPTAFEFSALANLVDFRLTARGVKRDFELEQNLRSPRAIAEFVLRADKALYKLLPRYERPRGQRGESPGDVTSGKVAIARVCDEGDLRSVFSTFEKLTGEAALVYPGATLPKPLADAVKQSGVTVWTSETIKGLEFRIVGVLDVPDAIQRIVNLAGEHHKARSESPQLAVELARMSVDRLLVALSRATETLVLFGSNWDGLADQTRPIVREILGQDAERDGTDDESNLPSEDSDAASEGYLGLVEVDRLYDLLEIDASDAPSRIANLLKTSQRFQDCGEYENARRLAENARGLLGPAGRPGSAPKELRLQVHRRLAVASLASGLRSGAADHVRTAHRAFRSAEAPHLAKFASALAAALHGAQDKLETWKQLRAVAEGLPEVSNEESSLVGSTVNALRQRIDAIDASSLPPTRAGREALLEALVALAERAPTNRDGFRQAYRRILVDCLHRVVDKTDKVSVDEYDSLRARLDEPTERTTFDARHLEARGEALDAMRQWESIEQFEDALRCARNLPYFAESARLAQRAGSPDAAILAWARELDALLESRPKYGSLTEREWRSLRAKLERR